LRLNRDRAANEGAADVVRSRGSPGTTAGAGRGATGRGRRDGGAACRWRWRRDPWRVLRVRDLRGGRGRRGWWPTACLWWGGRGGVWGGGRGGARPVSARPPPPPAPAVSPLPSHTARPPACHTPSRPRSVVRGRDRPGRTEEARPSIMDGEATGAGAGWTPD